MFWERTVRYLLIIVKAFILTDSASLIWESKKKEQKWESVRIYAQGYLVQHCIGKRMETEYPSKRNGGLNYGT